MHERNEDVVIVPAATRTNRMPKNSLFGSTLERLQTAEVARLADMDDVELQTTAWNLQRRQLRGHPGFSVSKEIQNMVEMQNKAAREEARQKFEHYQSKAASRRKFIEEQELAAKCAANVDAGDFQTVIRPNYTDRPRWMTVKDLEHTSEINCTGLTKRGNWNRDRYQPRAPTHRYALIGDLRRANMDFNASPMEHSTNLSQWPLNAAKRFSDEHRHNRKNEILSRMGPAKEEVAGIPQLFIPNNIKHKFGSEICDALLKDADHVASTQQLLQQERDSKKSRFHKNAIPMENHKISDYEQIGLACRSNVVGATKGGSEQIVSLQHQSFNKSVHERSASICDQHRFQKDHVSVWADANVHYLRMKRAQEQMRLEKLAKKSSD